MLALASEVIHVSVQTFIRVNEILIYNDAGISAACTHKPEALLYCTAQGVAGSKDHLYIKTTGL